LAGGGSDGRELQDVGDPWSSRGSGRAPPPSRGGRAPPPKPGVRGGPPRGGSRGAEPEALRVAIFGAGAVGGVIGAHLGRWVQHGAKLQLTLFTRGLHLQQLKVNGLWLNMPNGDSFVVQEGPFVAFVDGGNAADIGVQDYVLLTLRSDQLAEASAAIAPLLGRDTTVVTLHSGLPFWLCYGWRGELENEPLGAVDPTGQLWDVLQPDRSIGGVFALQAACTKPGEVTVTSLGDLVLGEPTGDTTGRIETLSELLIAAGINAPIEEDIRTTLWTRLQEDAVYGAVGALTLQSIGEMAKEPSSLSLLSKAMDELQSVGAAAGIECQLEAADMLVEIAGRDSSANHQPTMLRDLSMGKRPELESL
jgi:2-dehydropantoate 2-reductase